MNFRLWMAICSVGNGIIIFLVFIFLFIKDKEKYLRIVSVGWAIFIVHRLLRILSILEDIEIYAYVGYILYYIMIFIFIYGIHSFIEKPIKKWWIAALGICIAYEGVGNIIKLPYVMQSIIYIFPSIVLVWSGINIIKSKKHMGIGKLIVGWDFIVWGMQLTIFTILKNISWFITVGYFVYSLIFNILAFGILISYFETILKRLEKSEERYKLLVDLSPDAIGVVMDEKLTFANAAALKLLNANKLEQVKEYPYKKFLHPDYFEYGEKRFKALFNTKEPKSPKEIKIKALDGTVVEVETSIAPFPHGNKIGVLGIARDITERKNTERLKKSIEEKTRLLKEVEDLENLRNEFFANISHELRTPLNIILGIIQLRERDSNNISETDRYKIEEKYIKIIKQNCYRLLRLVNNLIDITKIDAGFYKANLQNCNIVNIVEDITLSVVDYIENNDITLVFDTEIEEKIIACDLDKIERIMMNLLSNAIKFTDKKGNILVCIKDDIDNIIITVKDDGIGIPKEKIDTIFERFKQVENTLTYSQKGSGIGLSLVKSLVEMHGGTISVKSEYLKGTEFIIKLPVKIIPEKITEKNNNFSIQQTLIERISIEFSDIYGT